MPDISKINALAIGSVAKVDGLAKASILDINGVAVPSAIAAPAAAYSVRLLGSGVGISSYTGDCMRVRRASDNVEADVGFDAGELKLTSPISNTSDAQSYTDFADFVDHTGTPTDAFCRWWYDQSGNSNDAGQSSQPAQPKIYDSATGIVTGNNKPALNFDGSNDFLVSPTITVTDGELLQSAVFVADANAGGVVSCDSSPVRVAQTITFQTTTVLRLLTFNSSGVVDTEVTSTANATGTQTLGTAQILSGQGEIFVDGSGTLAGTFNVRTDATTIQIAKATPFGAYFDGRIQEVLHWPSQQTNRTGIESDIDTFFQIPGM